MHINPCNPWHSLTHFNEIQRCQQNMSHILIKSHAWALLFFYFENASRTTTMVGLSIGASRATTIYGTFLYASRTSTMSGLSYRPTGHQPCMDFSMCQQDINHGWTFSRCQQDNNHIWTFLDANRTTTIF